MPKFEAANIRDLCTPERNAGRLSRRAKYEQPFRFPNALVRLAYIVAVEADDGSWTELDGESLDHARRLADAWVNDCNARGCSVWEVGSSGSLARRSSYVVFKPMDWS